MNERHLSPAGLQSLAERCAVWLTSLMIAMTAHAGPADLDPTFGIGGRGFADIAGADSAHAYAVAMQSDSKIVVAGKCFVAATLSTQMCAMRIQPNGFFDTSFGTGGTKLVNVGGTLVTEIVNAVATQPDGKIVLAGACGPEADPTEICVARLQADGSMDSGFGLSGKTRINFAGTGPEEARAVAILPSGKILLGGSCSGTSLSDGGVCLVRLNSDGTLDITYGTSGRTIVNSAPKERLTDMQIRPDGRVLIATEAENIIIPTPNPREYSLFVSQITAAGAFDSTFGIAGTSQVETSNIDRPIPRLALQPDGKIVVSHVNSSGARWIRLESNGTSEPGYASGISSPLTVDPQTFGIKPVLRADGSVYLVATTYPSRSASLTADFWLMRVFDTGTPATVFAEKTMLSASDVANDATLQADGKLVVVGTCDTGTRFQMCVARFEAASTAARTCTMDIDGDGKILATTDALILTRVSLGFSGAQVLNGISTTGTRNTWPLVREYLTNQCAMTGLAP